MFIQVNESHNQTEILVCPLIYDHVFMRTSQSVLTLQAPLCCLLPVYHSFIWLIILQETDPDSGSQQAVYLCSDMKCEETHKTQIILYSFVI